jgi:hypothetical protein
MSARSVLPFIGSMTYSFRRDDRIHAIEGAFERD